jgi:hypothetical protein
MVSGAAGPATSRGPKKPKPIDAANDAIKVAAKNPRIGVVLPSIAWYSIWGLTPELTGAAKRLPVE